MTKRALESHFKRARLAVVFGIILTACLTLATSRIIHAYEYSGRSFEDIYNDCIDNSPNPDFDVYKGACNLCATRETDPNNTWLGYSMGLGWFGSGPFSMEVDLTGRTGIVSDILTYYSGGYTCLSDAKYMLERWYTWFGSDPSDTNSKVRWIWMNNGGQENQYPINVGGFSGVNTWIAPNATPVSIDIDGFRNYEGTTCKTNDDGSETCETTIYVSGCAEPPMQHEYVFGDSYAASDGHPMQCGGTPTHLMLKLMPPQEPPEVKDVAGEFKSTSTITTPAGAITNNEYTETTSEDGSVEVFFSTDQPQVKLSFSHAIKYYNDGFTFATPAGQTDPSKLVNTVGSDPNPAITTVSTPWNVSGAYTVSDKSTSVNPDENYSATQNDSAQDVTVNLAPGETKRVCSKITYTKKYYTFSGEEHETQSYRAATAAVSEIKGHYAVDESGSYVTDSTYDAMSDEDKAKYKSTSEVVREGRPATPARPRKSHIDYVPSSSDEGSSYACATITRPKDPGGTDDTTNPIVAGNNNSDVMFAGEETPLTWNISATGVPTRRLSGRQVVMYHISADKEYNARYYSGASRNPSDPCSHYSTDATCLEYNSAKWNAADALYNTSSPADAPFSASEMFKVPNEVGSKVCNSAGYKFEWWWGISRDEADTSWSKDSDKSDYWYIYNSSCRTVAKKPSVVIWDSSIFSNGGMITSRSDRFDEVHFGEKVTDGNTAKKTFGSWSEFLAIANGPIHYFTSGSKSFMGSTDRDTLKNSSLTIANSTAISENREEALGYAQITPNTALLTRLNSYLRDRATTLSSNVIGSSQDASWTNMTGTNIYYHSGDLTISGNITLNSGPYSNLYDIPQVVIFVDGNVNISDPEGVWSNGDTQRIEAWIVATGNLNTCAEFAPGVTKSDASLPSSLKANGCGNQVYFGYPIFASNLILNRSFGSDPALARLGAEEGYAYSRKDAPAELFALHPYAYLWGYMQSSLLKSSYTESYSRELAPRY